MKTIELLRKLVREELGRNLQTPPAIDRMMDWRRLPGVEVTIAPDPVAGIWNVTIIDTERGHRLPTRAFKQESEAIHYGKMTAYSIYGNREQLATSVEKGPSWF